MADKQGNPTLYDVASAAGVSLATASRSLNGSARKVNDEYRQRVVAAAERLGYTANQSAQAVARGASRTVALLVSDVADPYFSSIAAGVVRAATAAGLTVTMSVTDREPQREIDLVRVLRGQRPQAILLAGSRLRDDASRPALVAELEAFTGSGGRVVAISQAELPVDTVRIANAAGARQLAAEVLDLGYGHIGILAGPANLLTALDRAESFVARLAEDGAEPAWMRAGEFTRDGGYAAMADVLDAEGADSIDAVFAVNDVMAIGALTALRERDVAVPGDVAVVGFDDIPSARDVYPPLTTVGIPLEAAGERAVELALSPAEDQPRVVEIGTSVVVRESSPRLG